MTTGKLLWNAIWRTMFWSALVGAVLSLTYVSIPFTIIFVLIMVDPSSLGQKANGAFAALLLPIFASIIGALLGLALGFVGGVLVGVLTRAFFFPLSDFRNYRRILHRVSIVITVTLIRITL